MRKHMWKRIAENLYNNLDGVIKAQEALAEKKKEITDTKSAKSIRNCGCGICKTKKTLMYWLKQQGQQTKKNF